MRGRALLNFLQQNILSVLAFKKQRKDTSFMLGIQLLLMLLGILSGVLTARLLGPEGRGQLAQIQLWTAFLLLFGGLALPNALVYYVSLDEKSYGRLIASLWVIGLPLSMFFVLIGYHALPHLLSNQKPETIFLAQLFLFTIPVSLASQAIEGFMGLKQFDKWAIMRVFIPVSYLIVILILFLLGQLTVFNLVICTMTTFVLRLPLMLFLLIKAKINIQMPRFNEMRILLSYGLRATLGNVPTELNTRFDQLLIAILLPPAEVGMYVISVSWSLILSGFFNTVGMVNFPYIASTTDTLQRKAIFINTTKHAFVVSIIAGAIMFVLTPVGIVVLFGNEFASTIPIAAVLVIAAVFYNLKLILGYAMRGMGRPEALAYTESFSIVVNIVLLILLIPSLGIMGAAIASLMTYILSTILMLVLVRVWFKYPLKEILFINHKDYMDIWTKFFERIKR